MSSDRSAGWQHLFTLKSQAHRQEIGFRNESGGRKDIFIDAQIKNQQLTALNLFVFTDLLLLYAVNAHKVIINISQMAAAICCVYIWEPRPYFSQNNASDEPFMLTACRVCAANGGSCVPLHLIWIF